MSDFNYSESAELYGGGTWGGRRSTISYRRFDSAAEAILYAVEELSDAQLRACVLEVNEKRFNHKEILKLYKANKFPLPREAVDDSDAG